MATRKLFVSVGLACSLAGCASMPNVTVSYYFPKAQTQIQITQTLICSKDSKGLFVVATVTPTTTYLSDRSVPRGSFSYKALNNPLSDADVTFSFTDDGRLASINATSQGEGDTIIKDAAAVVPIALQFLEQHIQLTLNDEQRRLQAIRDKKRKEVCAIISNYSSDDKKPITLTYSGTVRYDPSDLARPELLNTQLTIDPDPASKPLWEMLHDIYPRLEYAVQVSSTGASDDAATWTPPSDQTSKTTRVELNRFTLASIEVFGPDSTLEAATSIWKAELPVPLKPPHYYLPIPNPIVFGKQVFALQLSSYGSIQKVQYTKNTGVAEATDAASAFAKALTRPSAADQAAQLKGQADLIFQQQRVAQCMASPPDCK